MDELQGKAAIVTGAGRGIGAATARALAQLGGKVIVNDIDAAAAEECAAAIRVGGGQAIAHGADISDWDQAADLIATCKAAFGSVDGLINNAGLFALARLTELAKGDFDRMLAVNVVGTANCAAHAVKVMLDQGSGSIINVISGAHMGLPATSAYGASKGAAASLTYVWAAELAGTGVRVNAVSPMGETGMGNIAAEYYGRQGITPPRNSTPPGANAPVFAWLLSDRSRDINGQIIRIEGEQLSLCAHPAVMLPVLEQTGGWTLDSVDQAFAETLATRQAPQGITGIDIRGYGAPSRMWAAADASASGQD